jgi:hypothetical protein
MGGKFIKLQRISFRGPDRERALDFTLGVNVICGASDTGKSFLAEAIDFMLGGSSLKEIPERVPYGSAYLVFNFDADDRWKVSRALSGGNFEIAVVTPKGEESVSSLKQAHAQGRTDNISGFLLDKIGLLDKRILKSKSKGTTNSLSFRNLARLIVVQEGEIQSPHSPFLTGQFITKTSEIATIKLLLTGVDDSAVVSAIVDSPDNARQIALIDEIVSDLSSEIGEMGHEKSELIAQSESLQTTLDAHRESIQAVQGKLDERIADRKLLYNECVSFGKRQGEIQDLLARFKLLNDHYSIDKERLAAIQESGSLFAHVLQASCPLCGAKPNSQHVAEDCDGDVEAVVKAASAEIAKIDQLIVELRQTVYDLSNEAIQITGVLAEKKALYQEADTLIQASISPLVVEARSRFSEVVEKKAEVQTAIDMFDRLEKLQERRLALFADGEGETLDAEGVISGVPDASAHALSMKIEHILRAWNFPGDCRVHFDKERSDFVIDGKPRGSRGKGLRAITHAAITLGLMEYCREQSLPHPGFVVMDSPLLAYFEPEGEEDAALQGTGLKERFYEYLIQQHGRDSQVIIIENQHPPEKFQDQINLIVFTGNPAKGRFGLL